MVCCIILVRLIGTEYQVKVSFTCFSTSEGASKLRKINYHILVETVLQNQLPYIGWKCSTEKKTSGHGLKGLSFFLEYVPQAKFQGKTTEQ